MDLESMNVGPVLAVLIAVAHQARSDRIAVGVAADQDAAEIVASLRVEFLEKGAEIVIHRGETSE